MEKIKTDKPEVSEEILERWQSIVDIIATISDVVAVLIMKSEPPFMKISVSSQSGNKPYKPCGKEKMDGLYCEHVIRTGKSINIANALKEKSTKNKFVKLLSALHEKSLETEAHAIRMGELAKSLGKSIGLSISELDKLSLLASLHDIGKMMIPDAILNKPGSLLN